MAAGAGHLASLLEGAAAIAERESAAPPPVARILEAMLFAAEQPLTAEAACKAIRGLTVEQFDATIASLAHDYRRQNRPYAVHNSHAGYTLAIKPAYRGLRERLHGGPREAKLSPAALDVLALVAYKQPVGRAEIDSLRGQDSSANLRQLVRLGIIAVTTAGKASLYVTTPRLLELFGLSSLDELPQIMALHKV
jgi:segregation and condensation protein B